MTLKEAVEQLLETMPEDRQRQVLDFARFLVWGQEDKEWREFGRDQFARAYGPDEPDYTEADLRTDLDT